jgi:hypothetical protein
MGGLAVPAGLAGAVCVVDCPHTTEVRKRRTAEIRNALRMIAPQNRHYVEIQNRFNCNVALYEEKPDKKSTTEKPEFRR